MDQKSHSSALGNPTVDRATAPSGRTLVKILAIVPGEQGPYSRCDSPVVGIRDVGRNRSHTTKSDGTGQYTGSNKAMEETAQPDGRGVPEVLGTTRRTASHNCACLRLFRASAELSSRPPVP